MSLTILICNVAQMIDYCRIHESMYGENKNVIVKFVEKDFREKKCLEPLMENR